MENLGEIAEATADLSLARQLYSQALEGRLQTFGPGHILVMQSIAAAHVADIDAKQEDFYTAFKAYEEVLKVRTENLGRSMRQPSGPCRKGMHTRRFPVTSLR